MGQIDHYIIDGKAARGGAVGGGDCYRDNAHSMGNAYAYPASVGHSDPPRKSNGMSHGRGHRGGRGGTLNQTCSWAGTLYRGLAGNGRLLDPLVATTVATGRNARVPTSNPRDKDSGILQSVLQGPGNVRTMLEERNATLKVASASQVCLCAREGV